FMIGHPRFGFNENVNRPSLNEIDQLKNIGTPTIVDAQNRTGSMNPEIKPLKTGDSILGTAITVDLPAEDNLMLYKALQLAHPGDVLVVNTNNNFTRAIWGELMTLS